MLAHANEIKPERGMTVAFKASESQFLAGIPATIIDIWPRFRSGEYLVTLEYASPVRFRKTLIRHIDAFVSELERVSPAEKPRPELSVPRRHGGSMRLAW